MAGQPELGEEGQNTRLAVGIDAAKTIGGGAVPRLCLIRTAGQPLDPAQSCHRPGGAPAVAELFLPQHQTLPRRRFRLGQQGGAPCLRHPTMEGRHRIRHGVEGGGQVLPMVLGAEIACRPKERLGRRLQVTGCLRQYPLVLKDHGETDRILMLHLHLPGDGKVAGGVAKRP